MRKIKTLRGLDAAIKSNKYMYDDLMCFVDDIKLIAEIDSDSLDLQNAHDVLKEYSIRVPDHVIREIMYDDLWVACDVMTGNIHNSPQKEDFYHLLICYIGLGNQLDYTTEDLLEAADEYSIEIII